MHPSKGGSRVVRLSIAARVVHDLGLAACLGGTLFGKAAFNPSVGVVASKPERGKIGGTTWNRFNTLNTISFVLAAAAWLYGRLGRAGEGMGVRHAPGLVRVKDVLFGVTGPTGLAVLVLQILLYHQAPQGAVPLETGGVLAPEASARASLMQRSVSALGSVHVALFVALVATSAVLSSGSPETAPPPTVARRPGR